jgi:hypothetical protein
VQTTIDIDPHLFQQAEALARRKGQALSALVEQSLLKTLEVDQRESHGSELYGAPLTDEDIADSARVTFQTLDEDEGRAQTR